MCEIKDLFIATAPRKSECLTHHFKELRTAEPQREHSSLKTANITSGYKNYSEFNNKSSDK